MQVATANAAFLPLASSGFGLNQSTLPSRSLLDGGGLGGASIVTDQGSYDVGVGQRVRWGGGRYDVTWNSNRLESTNTFSNFNPSLAATASLTYTQPLLRGFRTDNERTQLVVSRIDRDISDIDLEETIVNTLADVRLAYWELVHAHAAVEVQRQSLALAEQLVRDNRARVEIGMVGEIEVVQARAEAALRRQSLAEAVRVLRTNELALKQLIVDGRTDELWNAGIDPTDEPRTEAIPIDLDATIRAALDRRTDINRVRRQIDINDARVENLRNSTLPALDPIGSYQLTGQGGPRLVPAGGSFEAILGSTAASTPPGTRSSRRSTAWAGATAWATTGPAELCLRGYSERSPARRRVGEEVGLMRTDGQVVAVRVDAAGSNESSSLRHRHFWRSIMFRKPGDQRSAPMPEVHLEDREWEGWTLCGQRLRPARGETVGLLYALSASGATCSICRSAGKQAASPRPDDSGVHVGVRVRIVCSSALEGRMGTVTSAEDPQVVTVRIDSDRRHDGELVRVKLAEVEPVAVAARSRP